MRYGAFRGRSREDIQWFKTTRSIEPGFYHRRGRSRGQPDVCISESVPALILAVYPWIRDAEIEFQHEVAGPDVSAAEKGRLAERMMDALVRQLDPDDPSAWIEDPLWLRTLRPANEAR